MGGLSGAEFAQSDAFAVIRTPSASINKGRVVPMHIEMLIVDEETFANGGVSIVQSMHVKPMVEQ